MAESTEEALGALANLLHGEPPSSPVSWEQIMRLTRRHFMSPFLYWCLQNEQSSPISIPPAVLSDLRNDYYIAHSQCMLRDRELSQIVVALDDAGIPALLFKGAALAHSVYPDPALRTMSDVDILVHKEQIEQTQDVLKQLEYKCQPEPHRHFNPFNTQFTGEVSFQRTVGFASTTVDLHWALLTNELVRGATAIDLDELWARTVPVNIKEATALVLAPEDQLMHICLHLSMHGFTHLRGYVDILQIVAAGKVDWNTFVSCAHQSRLRLACYFPLWWAARVWKANVPSWVLQALEPDLLRRQLGRWMLVKGIWRKPDTGHAWNHAAQMLVVDRFRDLIGILFWLLFPGPTWLQERYRLRKRWLAWIWIVVHPMVVLWEGMRSVLTLVIQIVRHE